MFSQEGGGTMCAVTDLWIWSKLPEPHLMASIFSVQEEDKSVLGPPLLGATSPQ